MNFKKTFYTRPLMQANIAYCAIPWQTIAMNSFQVNRVPSHRAMGSFVFCSVIATMVSF